MAESTGASTRGDIQAQVREARERAECPGVRVGFDAVATCSDPFGSLFAAGLEWIIADLRPIKGRFDDHTGDSRRSSRSRAPGATCPRAPARLATTSGAMRTRKRRSCGGLGVQSYRKHVEWEIHELGDAVRLIHAEPTFAHLLQNNPDPWRTVVDDAVKDGIRRNAANAAEALQ
ncbi:MAG: hypothetical protein ABIU87_04105 [Ornithinibacter sp.]